MAFQNNHLFGKPKSSLRTVGTIFSLENRKKNVYYIFGKTHQPLFYVSCMILLCHSFPTKLAHTFNYGKQILYTRVNLNGFQIVCALLGNIIGLDSHIYFAYSLLSTEIVCLIDNIEDFSFSFHIQNTYIFPILNFR